MIHHLPLVISVIGSFWETVTWELKWLLRRGAVYIYFHIQGYGYRHSYGRWEIVVSYGYVTLVLHI